MYGMPTRHFIRVHLAHDITKIEIQIHSGVSGLFLRMRTEQKVLTLHAVNNSRIIYASGANVIAHVR